jgi:DNA-binding MarR family transcriptional regulator
MINCLQRTLSRQAEIDLSEYGLSGVQMHTLVFLRIKGLHGEKVCQRDIERETGLRPSSVSSMITVLEKNGFIVREQSQSDARTKYLNLTEKGVTVCEKHKKVMVHGDILIEDALTPEEQESLKYLLNKILDYTKQNKK